MKVFMNANDSNSIPRPPCLLVTRDTYRKAHDMKKKTFSLDHATTGATFIIP